MADQDNPNQILEEILELSPDELSDDQKSVLDENKDNLTPEQSTKFGYDEKEDEEDDSFDPDKFEVKTRKVATDEEDEDIDPDDKKTISKIVDRDLERRGLSNFGDQYAVDSYVRENPDMAKYGSAALKWMEKHPTAVVEDAIYAVAGKNLLALGAKREREAQQRAKDTQGNTTTVRKTTSSGVDWSTASKEDYEAQRAKVLGRGI